MSRTLARIHSYAGLIQTLKARRDELNISNETIDELAGMTPNHAAKIMAQHKHLGPVSWCLLEAMGLAVVIVEDQQALARSQRKSIWRKRRQPQSLPVTPYPRSAA